jgi:hypothetical protein
VTFTLLDVAAGEVEVAVADHVPVPSPFCDWMLNDPPLTARVRVTFVEPDFDHVMVIDMMAPT